MSNEQKQWDNLVASTPLPSVRAGMQAARDKLLRRIADLEWICNEAYQVVGVLGSDAGRFGSGDLTKILDNLSTKTRVHEDVLPFESGKSVEALEAEIEKLKEQASDRASNGAEFAELERQRLDGIAQQDWDAWARDAMKALGNAVGRHTLRPANPGAWIDQNVSGNPALIEAMKNHAGANQDAAQSPIETTGGAEALSAQSDFNAAINFAIEQGPEAAQFLIAWREGDMSEWTEFSRSPSTPEPN